MKKIFYLVLLLTAIQLELFGQEKVEVRVTHPEVSEISGGGYAVSSTGDVRIGGRNYVRNSAFLENYSGWTITGKCFTETKDGIPSLGLNSVGNYATDGYVRSPQMSNLMIDEFTLSFLIWSLNGFVSVDFDGDYDNTITRTVPAGSWQKVAITVKASRTIRNLNFCLYGTTSQVMDGWVTRFKLEYGNQATDWSPAPEDVTQKFSDAGINTATKAMSLNKLDVNGTIRAKEIRVETGWADDVFEDDYKLLSLDQVASHIREKKHLPGIPSAKEIERDGADLARINVLLLRKIEELTLYVIRQQNQINELKSKVKE